MNPVYYVLNTKTGTYHDVTDVTPDGKRFTLRCLSAQICFSSHWERKESAPGRFCGQCWRKLVKAVEGGKEDERFLRETGKKTRRL